MLPSPRAAAPLQRLRLIWYQFFFALGVILVVLLFLDLPLGDFPTGWLLLWLAATVAATALALFTRRRATAGLLEAGSADEMVARYQTRFFLGVAFSEVPALLAFVIAFIADSVLPYVFGLAVSTLLILWAGPHPADIRTLDEALIQAGAPLKLSEALSGQD